MCIYTYQMETETKIFPGRHDQCASFNLRKTSRVLTQAFDDALRPSGLRGTQFSLLAVLQTRQPVGMTKLAKWMEMDRTTLTRNLKPLEKEGLVKIEPGIDSRVHQVSLTSQGELALEAAQPLWAKAQARVVQALGSERILNLLEDLSAARQAVKE